MITRRSFARRVLFAGTGAAAFTEAVLAQRALVGGRWPPDTVWLNANENPDGPCPAAVEAMRSVLAESWRYHFQEFRDFTAAVAASEQLGTDQVVVGAGSTEVLNCVVAAFTSPSRPVIMPAPTFESPAEAARALGRPVVQVPLTESYAIDVKRLCEEARKSGGGLIYLCNPNNPTSLLTPKEEVDWLAANLPSGAVLLVDEAYLHFVEDFQQQSAMAHVRQGRNVIVARTFSKIYGMAGLRVGFCCGKPELIAQVRPLRNNPISIVGMRAVLAALGEAATMIPQRRARLIKVRSGLCEYLKSRGLRYLEPSANFMMIDVGTDVSPLAMALLEKGVAVGRRFSPLDTMLRVTIGTENEMEKFRSALASALA